MKFDGFEILNGEKKILISCPHAVEQTRDGKIKPAEEQTAVLAKMLNKIGYPAIIKTENIGDDANYDLDCPYKQQLKKYCQDNNICFVLDLHQLSSKREMDFCLGTGDEQNRNLLSHTYLATDVQSIAKQNGFDMTINNPFAASTPKTISGFCCQNNIPSMQLEINSRLVAPYCNATQLDDVYNFIANICDKIIKDFFDENTFDK